MINKFGNWLIKIIDNHSYNIISKWKKCFNWKDILKKEKY